MGRDGTGYRDVVEGRARMIEGREEAKGREGMEMEKNSGYQGEAASVREREGSQEKRHVERKLMT